MIVWDASVQRYRDTDSGRFVAEDAVRSTSDALAGELSNFLAGITQELLEHRRNLKEWQRDFANAVVDHHLAAAAVGAGGLEQLRAAVPSAAQSRIRDQLKFLRRFAQDLESGKQPFNGRAVARARLYGAAVHSAFEEQRRANWVGHIETEERWLLSAAEHCSGCLAQAARGYVPLGSLPPIGSQQCRTRCRCRIVHRRSPTSQDPCSVSQGRPFKTAVK